MHTALKLLALLCCLPLGSAAAAPEGGAPVRIVVPAPAGGNLDKMARKLAQRLSALTGEPHMVDNRPGGNTLIGTEAVARAPADGRTLLYTGTGIVLVGQLQKLPASPMADLAPVIQVTRESYVLGTAAGSSVSLQNLREIAAGKPGGLDCVTIPGVTELACEQLKARLDGNLTIVRYAGIAPALNAVVAGVGDVVFMNAASVAPLLETGRMRVLAVGSHKGMPASMAQAPVLADVWPGFVLEGMSGLFVPARTPRARIEQVNRDASRALALEDTETAMREPGQEIVGGSVAQFAEFLARSERRFAALIQSLGLAAKPGGP